MSRRSGRRYDDTPKLNKKKVLATILTIIVINKIKIFSKKVLTRYWLFDKIKVSKGERDMSKQEIRNQINEMVKALDYARSIDEAWDIEQGIIELEDMLYKGERQWKASI